MRSHKLLAALAALAATLGLAACGPGGNPNVAATVNEEDIAVEDLETRVDAVRANPQISQQFEDDPDGAFEQQVANQVLNELITVALIDQGAAELGVAISEADVEERRVDFAEELGGEEAFEELVEQSGISAAEAGEQIRRLAITEQVSEELGTEVSDEDVQAAYDQQFGGEGVRARHILVEEAEVAEQILGRLEAGSEFEALAAELSTDGSAQQGGDLGVVQPGQTVAEFEEALFAAEPGEVVGPVETQFGFHVIERLDVPPLEEVEEDLREQLAAQAGQQVFQEWLNERRLAAEVTVNPRFGTWDAETGQLVPEEPLGEAATVDPDAEGAPQEAPAGTAEPAPAQTPTAAPTG